jgi:hypothetical protein
MNAGARAASYAAQSRARRAGAMAEAAGGALKPLPAPKPSSSGIATGSLKGLPASSMTSEAAAPVVLMTDGDDADEEEADQEEENADDAEIGSDDDTDDDEFDDEEDDDDDDESGSDAEKGTHGAGDASAAVPPFAERLPIFEDPSSHLLFKRLLQRESVEREAVAAVPGAIASTAQPVGAKRRRPGPDGATGGAARETADAVLGRLLLQRLRGSLARTASSNRACLVLVEMLWSSDLTVAAAVRAELVAQRATLVSQPDCVGKQVLLAALSPRPQTALSAAPVPAATTASRTASASRSSGGDSGSGKPVVPPTKAVVTSSVAPAAPSKGGSSKPTKRK